MKIAAQMKTGPVKKSLIQRLTDRAVIMETNCIEWDGPVDKKTGYTRFCITDEQSRKLNTSAHRVSAHVFLGLDLSDRKTQANHSCDNRKCINPVHLMLGSQKDNIQDCKTKGRRADVRGMKNPQSKLTTEDVDKIRTALRDAPRGSRSRLAESYGVSGATIRYIETGKRWGQ